MKPERKLTKEEEDYRKEVADYMKAVQNVKLPDVPHPPPIPPQYRKGEGKA